MAFFRFLVRNTLLFVAPDASMLECILTFMPGIKQLFPLPAAEYGNLCRA
jgi:hypothetical protein